MSIALVSPEAGFRAHEEARMELDKHLFAALC